MTDITNDNSSQEGARNQSAMILPFKSIVDGPGEPVDPTTDDDIPTGLEGALLDLAQLHRSWAPPGSTADDQTLDLVAKADRLELAYAGDQNGISAAIALGYLAGRVLELRAVLRHSAGEGVRDG
jgi:hypothetical protein